MADRKRGSVTSALSNAKRGSDEANSKIDEFIRRSFSKYLKVQLRSLQRILDPDDILQDSITVALKKLQEGSLGPHITHSRESFAAWLTNVIRKKIRFNRRTAFAKRRDFRRSTILDLDSPASQRETADELAAGKEVMDLAKDRLEEELDPQKKLAILRLVILGMSPSELADSDGVPESHPARKTLVAKYRRWRDAFHQKLKKEYFPEVTD